MKILIINDRYFISGGPERYLFNLKSFLENKGHDVIPFSVKYSMNELSVYDKYFVSPLAAPNEIYFRNHSWTLTSLMKTISRLFFSREAYSKLCELIKNEKPDFAIVLNYFRKLSPAILLALKNQNIPFVVRLSDYNLICANGHLIRNEKICELCIKHSSLNSIRYRCVQNSFGASLINYLSIKYHQYTKTLEVVRYFIIPSEFTKKKMIEAGWEESKLVHVPTFVLHEEKPGTTKKKKQAIYVGRVERIKGVHLILEAYKNIFNSLNGKNISVIIAGSGSEDYIRFLREFTIKNGLLNIEFVGSVEKHRLFELLSESAFSISPSLWYDNMPNSVLESLSCGTCVIASDHGSFAEIVKNGETGLLFKPNNAIDLAHKMKYLFDNFETCIQMGKKGIDYIKEFHAPEQHYYRLMQIYARLADNQKP